jgi:hypothetical protein
MRPGLCQSQTPWQGGLSPEDTVLEFWSLVCWGQVGSKKVMEASLFEGINAGLMECVHSPNSVLL